MVDSITSISPWIEGKGTKSVGRAEPYLEQHFPWYPVMPGNLMLEHLAQLTGWLVAASTDFTKWARLTRVETAKFRRPVRPGETLETAVTVAERDGNQITVGGEGRVGGQLVVQAVLTLQVGDCPERWPPDRLHQAYSELCDS